MIKILSILLTSIMMLEIVTKILEKKIEKNNKIEYDVYEIISILRNTHQFTDFAIETNCRTFSYSFFENKICVDRRNLSGHILIKGVHEISHVIDSSTKISRAIYIMMPHIRLSRWLLIGMLMLSRNVFPIEYKPYIYLYLGLSIISVVSIIYLETRANCIVKTFANMGSDRSIMAYIWLSLLLQIIWRVFLLVIPLSIFKILCIV